VKTFSAATVCLLVVLVACGSPTPPSGLSDTWTFDSQNWYQSSSDIGPTARSRAVFVYDAAADQVVLFGGYPGGDAEVSETWTWNGHWTLRHPSHSPPARAWAAAAYDPIRRNVVLQGGVGGGGNLSDTWTWDGNDWNEVNPTDVGPAGLFSRRESAAFDPVSRQVIFLNPCGWFNSDAGCSTDTWGWDGGNWTRYRAGDGVPPRPSPAPLNINLGGAIIYADAKHGDVVMLGGSSPLVWDGSKWSSTSSLSSLPETAGGAVAYDDQASTAISFGAAASCLSTSSDDTWEWDGLSWQQVQPNKRPPARSSTYLAYDSMTRSIVMFGGDFQAGGCGIGNLP
jgi:hypothetical protein